jgi:hypothetical protein
MKSLREAIFADTYENRVATIDLTDQAADLA